MVVGKNGAANQEESVYNLVPRTEVRAPKPPRYESKFKHQAEESLNKGKADHRTFGFANEALPDPEHFLKKQPKALVPVETKETQQANREKEKTTKAMRA